MGFFAFFVCLFFLVGKASIGREERPSYLESELENDSPLFCTMEISSNISLETVATDNPINHLLYYQVME